MSSIPFDQRYNFAIDHIDCLLAEAADDRQALLIHSVSLPRVWTGNLLMGLGRALMWAGERVGG